MAIIANDIKLVPNGKYISKNNDSVQLENSPVGVTHLKPNISSKKMSTAHRNNDEPDNINSNLQYEKAAELKNTLERELSLEQTSENQLVKVNSEVSLYKKDTVDLPSSIETEKQMKNYKYFSYQKSKLENKHLKRVYKIENKYKIIADNTDNISLFRKIKILNKDVLIPIKRGNVINITAMPTKIFLKRLLEKSSLGRAAISSKETSDKIIEAASNGTDTSQSMAAATEKAAKELYTGTANGAYRYIKKKIDHNKYIVKSVSKAAAADKKIEKENKYFEKALSKLSDTETNAILGNASSKLEKKIEYFNKKNYEKKHTKLDKQNQRLENKIKKQIKASNKQLKKTVKKSISAKLMGMLAASGIATMVPILLIIIVLAIIVSYVFYPFFYITITEDIYDEDGNVIGTEDIQEDSEVSNTVSHYYSVMDGVVTEINSTIDTIFAGGDKYNNTGVVDPAKKAQYDIDFQYYTEHAFNSPPPPLPDENSIYYTAEELYEMGAERGPIFMGFRWSDDTDATRVPYGKLYDEILCTIATYNAKKMNQAGNTDIIFMNDETVEGAYAGANFWSLSHWTESVGCTTGDGDCCSKKVAKTVYNDDGEAVGVRYETENYCPGHFVIMVKLKLNFNLDDVWDSYGLDSNDQKNYDDILKQLKKDK